MPYIAVLFALYYFKAEAAGVVKRGSGEGRQAVAGTVSGIVAVCCVFRLADRLMLRMTPM